MGLHEVVEVGWSVKRLLASIERLLPQDPKRRLRTVQTALACMFAFASLGFMLFGVVIDAMAWQAALGWSLLTALGGVGFITAIRSGWSERFADPSLTVAQMVYAISCCALAYGIAGSLRGAIFPLLMVVMMFGMFSLKIRHVMMVCAYAVLAMGLSMALLVAWRPDTTTPLVEAGHLLMLALMMPAVALLAQRLHRMRGRLQDQRRELTEALDRIQYLATRDSLTGLMNRRHVTELIEREVQRRRRFGARLSVAMFDLDHFKHINDRYGHGCGDEVLRAFADEAQRTIRGCDALARWGGEEFLLLMPETGLEDARVGAERVRAMLERHVITKHGERVPVTLSSGVAELGKTETIESLVERADQALYLAKSHGRNRVEIAK